MRVFVTGTGRCGSVTFSKACHHIHNYTIGHESPNVFLEYPDNHIEVNPQFRHCLTLLSKKYPDSVFVHLKRERGYCVPSLAALDYGKVVECYRLLYNSICHSNSLEAAKRFYDCETEIIDLQLKAHSGPTQTILLKDVKSLWSSFWTLIGAEGNFEASRDTFDERHNTREQRGESSYSMR